MLEINAQAFMDAVMEMRRVQAVIDHVASEEQRAATVEPSSRPLVLRNVEALLISVSALYARAALVSTERLKSRLSNAGDAISWADVRTAMADIESRLRDELGMVKLFVADQTQATYLAGGEALVGSTVVQRFPSLQFELEEAAKCLALSRPTASAFHAMRALEGAIGSLAKFLHIPDPIKPAERNWAIVLAKIKSAVDENYPAKSRLGKSEGAKVEALYATLDAVKNPWRNATMHVENVYQPPEANHILNCVHVFVVKLGELCDEAGLPVEEIQHG